MLSPKVTVQLIAATETTSGLNLSCVVDAAPLSKSAKIPDLHIDATEAFYPDWNYPFSLTTRPIAK